MQEFLSLSREEQIIEREKNTLEIKKYQRKYEEWKSGRKERREASYMKVMFSMLDNPEWRKSNRTEFGLWLYLCSYIVRAPMSNDRYDIYNRYYCNGKLACFRSIRKMSDDFGYSHESKSQVKRWIKSLFEEGAFTKEFIDVGKQKPQTVYILGELKTVYNEKTNENTIHEILYYNKKYE